MLIMNIFFGSSIKNINHIGDKAVKEKKDYF